MAPLNKYSVNPENELVTLMAMGDRRAFEQLYTLYKQPVYNTILQFLPPAMAADVLQDIFMQVWLKPGAFDPSKGSLFTWLHSITRNKCIDVMRKADYRMQQRTGEVPEDTSLHALYSAHVSMDTGLLTLINKLRPQSKTIVNLAYVKGYTRQEISELLDLPVNTVKTRLRRALLELRELMEENRD